MARTLGGRPYFDNRPAYVTVRTKAILLKARLGMAGMKFERRGTAFAQVAVLFVAAAACATVKVEAPDKPIEINLNVNIKQEVLIKMDKEIEDLIANNPDIF